MYQVHNFYVSILNDEVFASKKNLKSLTLWTYKKEDILEYTSVILRQNNVNKCDQAHQVMLCLQCL